MVDLLCRFFVFDSKVSQIAPNVIDEGLRNLCGHSSYFVGLLVEKGRDLTISVFGHISSISIEHLNFDILFDVEDQTAVLDSSDQSSYA